MNFHGGNIYEYDNNIIDFSSNINPLGVSEKLKNAIIERIDEVSIYPDINYNKLKNNISKYINVDKSMITVGNGAVDIIYRAVQNLPMNNVVIMAPTFSEYRKAAELSGKRFFEIPSFNFEKNIFDMSFFDSKIHSNSIIIICNPNNPTGVAIDKQSLTKFLKNIKDKGCFVIIDEAFMEFTCNENKFSMVDMCNEFENLIVIRAVTKFFGLPGIRLGYGISSNKIFNEAMENSSKPWDINTFAVIASAVIFNDYEYIEKSKKWIKEETEFMYENISKIKGFLPYKTNCNFMLVKSDKNSEYIEKALLKYNILIRIPKGFTGLSKNFIRVAIKDRESNIKLINALRSEFCE